MILADMSHNLWALLQAVIYALILLEGCCLIRLLDRCRLAARRLALGTAMLLSFLLLIHLDTCNYQCCSGTLRPPYSAISQMPAWVLFLLLPLVYGWVLSLLYEDSRFRRNAITQAAVKESLDNLPTGLCFSDRSGAVLLSNRRIQSLCHTVTGSELQDASQFWAVLSAGDLAPGVQRLPDTANVMLRLKDGSVWTFGQRTIHAGDEDVTELSAADTTDLYHLTCQLRENNRALEDMNRRLQQHSENVDTLARSRELLDTKVRIHDDFGQALLATRYLLSQDGAGMAQDRLLEQWRRIVSVLRREAEPVRPAGDWASLAAAAEASGVQVVLSGSLPESETARNLLIGATAEALTNAVRHGDATVLSLTLTASDGLCTAVFTNNGTPPKGPIAMGGGLSALERRLRDVGGSLAVTSSPAFALTVTIPTERRKLS